ncbi:DUF6933 domain-containing protein [Companilactobacillus halodurans]|uniref:DUF6933 domain-containing protein n=1 Tax=Companilactobacillus halodurans TaxID=2584183 RepID=A0A5P0ZPC2_9LACO|nr:hypothetical protein [Companilactobacillus halodurans]MQS76097.1 hypothetical protein [Companilactobacillus halodurans]MQS96532.1 hypothetical protein [Companilactobacillus halodurans]
MFINVVQKAQSLFKDYQFRQNSDQIKNLVLGNPIFSWHVKYLNHKRKKVVVFTNDATTLSIVLYDVNAKNRSQIQKRFQEKLNKVWQSLGLSQSNLEQYLKIAKDWEVGPTVSRSQRGRLNEVSLVVETYLEDNEIDEDFLSSKATGLIRNVMSGKTIFSENTADILRAENLKWKKIAITEPDVNLSEINQIHDELIQIEHLAESDSFFDDLDQSDNAVEKIRRLNNQLIDSFIQSVKGDYAEKTVKSYENSLKLYLNEYLAFRFITVFNYESDNVSDLYLHGSSMQEVKRVQKSMVKFYQFLANTGVIDLKFAKTMKQGMKDNIELLNLW